MLYQLLLLLLFQLKNKIPELRVGNTVRVHVRIKEGNKERIQVFEGIIIKKQGGGVNSTFTVRKTSYGVGVEKTFLVHSPLVEKVEVVRVGKAYEEIKDDAQGIIRITLKYDEKGNRVIDGLRRISKPGLRVYASKEELPKVLNGLGIAIISTSQGLKTDKEARQLGVGGEVLAYVW